MSDVARIIRQIDLERESLQNALYGLASGVSRHDFIEARAARGADHILQLVQEGKRYANCVQIGGNLAPIYRYTLIDGGILLVQFLRSHGYVTNHPDHYWTALYIRKEGSNGADKTRTEAR